MIVLATSRNVSVSPSPRTSAAEPAGKGISHSPSWSGWCLKGRGCLCVWANPQRLLCICWVQRESREVSSVQHLQRFLYALFLITLVWVCGAWGSTWCFSERVEGIFRTLETSPLLTSLPCWVMESSLDSWASRPLQSQSSVSLKACAWGG